MAERILLGNIKGEKGEKGEQGNQGVPGQIGSAYLPKLRLDENSNLYYTSLPNVIKNGLVLWYDFEGKTNSDPNRTNATDLSGNGNHGTLQNFNFNDESGYDKNKLLFDGVNDGITKTTNASLDSLEEVTLDIVFSLDRLGSFQRLIDMHFSYMSLAVWTGDLINFNSTSLSPSNSLSSYKVPLNKVLHLSVTHSKDSGDVNFYINGVKDSTTETTGVLGGTPGDLVIGAMGVNHTQTMKGKVYSTKIYNRPLTPKEIAHNYEIEKERLGIE